MRIFKMVEVQRSIPASLTATRCDEGSFCATRPCYWLEEHDFTALAAISQAKRGPTSWP